MAHLSVAQFSQYFIVIVGNYQVVHSDGSESSRDYYVQPISQWFELLRNRLPALPPHQNGVHLKH